MHGAIYFWVVLRGVVSGGVHKWPVHSPEYGTENIEWAFVFWASTNA